MAEEHTGLKRPEDAYLYNPHPTPYKVKKN